LLVGRIGLLGKVAAMSRLGVPERCWENSFETALLKKEAGFGEVGSPGKSRAF
jgi:hypothetical protein